jgi:hypothetical protein
MSNMHHILSTTLAACALVLAASSTSYALWTNIGTRTNTRLCPTHVGGDREYDGHGPDVDGFVELYTSSDGRELWMHVYMHQLETRQDWSEAIYDRHFRLHRASSGVITQVWSNGTSYSLSSAGGPVTDFAYTDTDHQVDWFYPGTFIDRFAIKGDTGGNDIGNCTEDDAYLSVYTNALWVWTQ